MGKLWLHDSNTDILAIGSRRFNAARIGSWWLGDANPADLEHRKVIGRSAVPQVVPLLELVRKLRDRKLALDLVDAIAEARAEERSQVEHPAISPVEARVHSGLWE
jgi:hypothetical protein